jgi:hypothetical protein
VPITTPEDGQIAYSFGALLCLFGFLFVGFGVGLELGTLVCFLRYGMRWDLFFVNLERKKKEEFLLRAKEI